MLTTTTNSSSPSTALQQIKLVRQNNNALTPRKSPVSQPSTPSPASHPPSPAVSTPGKWQHPRLDEVLRRQDATRFDRDHVAKIASNAMGLAISFAIPWVLGTYLFHWPNLSSLATTEQYLPWAGLYTIILIVRLAFSANILYAFAPFLRREDKCEDIPLTPAQRHLLGLAPMSRPATPQEQEAYVTPPRYSRGSTPRDTSQSPQLGSNGSPMPRRSSGTPTRSSLGASNSPRSLGDFDAAGNAGTPTKGTKASVGLNSKWLYEKGRVGSPRGSGTGSGSSRLSGSVFM